jgi:hypothetical protein
MLVIWFLYIIDHKNLNKTLVSKSINPAILPVCIKYFNIKIYIFPKIAEIL